LLEGLVFADRVARALPSATPCEPGSTRTVTGERDTPSRPESEAIRAEMRAIMTADVGVVRTETSLLRAERVLDALLTRTYPGDWRTRNQLLVAGLITRAARRRRESRGGHRRADYPPKTRRTRAG
jgi:aspartate oxidase